MERHGPWFVSTPTTPLVAMAITFGSASRERHSPNGRPANVGQKMERSGSAGFDLEINDAAACGALGIFEQIEKLPFTFGDQLGFRPMPVRRDVSLCDQRSCS